MANLLEQLQSSLSGAYTIERELGGGGMSRVFLAEEIAFGRRVVVKLLEPEQAAGVNIDRFKREIQLAAKLQHPHIVPIITAGESAGLPYYTMPFVDGETLGARIAREGKLPIGDAITILRDVAKALTYAHEHGIVHRDIKPDNILLSGGSATVADFGIAKALNAARTEERGKLTLTGTSIGTPGYMAPEQAAGDPDVDHRADIYSLGCLAYEMLAGQPPFAGRTLQHLLAAHMSEMPRAVAELRPDTPPRLADLLMRSLAKDPHERPQTAAELSRELDALGSGTSQVLLKRALVVYAAAFVIVTLIARVAIFALGLPDWVFPGSLIVMGLGLPVILFTAYTHGSWRRTVLGGAYALGSFTLLVGAFMTLRALGIGPFGSLLASGEVGSEPLIVTEFATVNADSTLGAVISQAVRSNLDQSSAFRLMPQDAMTLAVQRMQRPRDSRIDLPLAREIAAREGLKAIVEGEIAGIGSGFLVTVRLVSADSARTLASFHEPADGAKELIEVVDRLSLKLRGRIGESLRDVRGSLALSQVTTPSIDALRNYTDAWKATGAGDRSTAVTRARAAVAIDSNFAMAWALLATSMINASYPQPPIDSARTRAYQLRDRLPERERLTVTGAYFGVWGRGPGHDRRKGIAAKESLVAMGVYTSTNNLGWELASKREFARADSFARYRIRMDPGFGITYGNLIGWQLAQGKIAAAESTFALSAARFPGWERTADGTGHRARLLYARGEIDGAIAVLDSGRLRHSGPERAEDLGSLASFAMLRGQFGKRERLLREASASRDSARAPSAVGDTVEAIVIEAWFRGPSLQHARRIDALVASPVFTAPPPGTRAYFVIANAYAVAGRPDRARALLARYEAEVQDTALKRGELPRLHGVLGEIALAEERPMDAVSEFRQADLAPDGPSSSCVHCLPAMLARAFDAAGNADSTMAAIERYLAVPRGTRVGSTTNPVPIRGDYFFLAPFEKRLGELYEAKGNHAKAAEHFQQFLELWKNADPEMQPKVNEVRQRLTRLRARERR